MRRSKKSKQYLVEQLEGRRLLSGVTVITHGFEPGVSAQVPNWVDVMANSIASQEGGADIYELPIIRDNLLQQPHSLGLVPISLSPNNHGNYIIELNWAQVADHLIATGDGVTAGDIATLAVSSLTSALIDGHKLAELPIHLIGHSRGASVVAQLASRLGSVGVWVEQITFLDPHPLTAFDLIQTVIPTVDPQMVVTKNVIFADNYYETSDPYPHGEFVSGTLNIGPLDLSGGQSNINVFGGGDHADVHTWYNGTIDTSVSTFDGVTIPSDSAWYSNNGVIRNVTGFGYSKIRDGARPSGGLATSFGGTGQRADVQLDPTADSQWANIDQIKLRNASATLSNSGQVFLSYRYQDSDSASTITWFADQDQNPFNANFQQLAATQQVTASASVVRGMYNSTLSGISAANHYIYARIADAAGHVRYSYLPQAVTFSTAAPATIASGQLQSGTIVDDVDVYAFSATAGGKIVASMGATENIGASYSMQSRIQIYGPNGQLLGTGFGGIGGGIGTVTVDAPTSGIYYAVAGSADGDQGIYKLAVASAPAIQFTDSDGGPISSGQMVTGNIDGELDSFTIQAVGGGKIVASMGATENIGASYSMQSRLQLFSPTGQLLGTALGGTGGGIATITVDAATTGSYYIVASSADGDRGAYKLSAASLPSTQVTDSDGGPISSGQMITGNIDGELDSYSFQGMAGGTIVASMGATENIGASFSMQSRLQIFSPTGALLGTGLGGSGGGVGTLTVGAATTGTYYVVASSADGDRGAYKLSVASAPGTQITDPDGGPLNSGQMITGNIDGELDSYSFLATAGGKIVASMGATENIGASSSMQSRIQLFSATGLLLGTGLGGTGGGIATLTVDADTTGTYYLVASSADGDRGAYKLSVASAPATQISDSDGGPISSGQMITGNIDGELDSYSFQGMAGGTIVASMGATENIGASFSMQSRLQIFSPTGALLGTGVGGTGGAVGTLTVDAATTGTYYLVASSMDGDRGAYKLAVASVPGIQVTDSDGGSISSGQLITGNIDGDLDSFSFQATAGGNIAITMTPTDNIGASYAMQPRIQLFSSTGQILGTALGGTGGGPATFQIAAQTTGTYYLVASSADGDRGNYQLKATFTSVSTPIVSIAVTDSDAAEQGLNPGVFTVTRTGSTAAALPVNYSIAVGAGQATNGSDYNLISGSVTIPIGQLSAPITITPNDDSIPEGSESVQLTLTASGNYAVGSPASATITIADNDVSDTPVAWYKFDESAGTTAADASGNNNTATVAGGATFIQGKSGNALTLNGSTSQYATAANLTAIDPTTAITLSAWINPTDWAGNRRILQKGLSDNQYRLLAESGLLKFDLKGVGSVTAALPSVNAWHLITGTYDGATMTLYVDGVAVISAARAGTIATTADALFIGAKKSGDTSAGDFFKGKIDDVRVYGRALTAAEVLALAGGTVDTTKPSTPGTPTLVNKTDTSVLMAWTPSTDNIAVVRYDVFRDGVKVGSTATASYSDSGRTASTTYTYAVQAFDAAGNASTQSGGFTVTTNPAQIATLVAWYKFDESTGTTAADASGNSNTGTVAGGATFTAGHAGNALTLNGSTQYAAAANAAALNPTAGITLSAWVNATDWAGNRRILQKGALDNQYRILAENGLLKFDLKNVGSVTAALPTVGVWHLVTGTYDGANMKLYVDGVQVAIAAKTGLIATTADPLYIGTKKAGDTTPGNYLKGKIDDVRIYSTALTQAEVQVLAGGASDTVAPTTPGTPTLVNKTDTSVSIAWTASTDNVGVSRYDIFRGATKVGSTSGVNFTDGGLTASTAYTYKVQAFDAAGNSSGQSAGLTVTTNAASATAPVAWYKFDEASGTSAADSSGNGNAATLVNGPTFAAGHSGNALTLNGSTQVAQIANTAALNPTTAITLSAWVNATDWSGNRRILQKGLTDNQYRLLAENGVLKFDLKGVGSITAALPTVGVWHLITGTYDGASMTLYIDGVAVTTAAKTGVIAVTADPLYIGAKKAGDTTTGNFFKGKIDDVRIYSKALSAAEVLALLNG